MPKHATFSHRLRLAVAFVVLLNVGRAHGELALELTSARGLPGDYRAAVGHGRATSRAGRLVLEGLPGRGGLLLQRA